MTINDYQVSLTPTFLGTLAAQIPVITAGSLLGGTAPGEMLVNSNFANGLANWITAVGTASATIDTAQHKIGSQSAKVVGGFISQTAALTAGHTYQFQAWVQAAGNTLVGNAIGAAIDVSGGAVTLQKASPASAISGSVTGAILAATVATSFTFLQLTFVASATQNYTLSLTDNFGGTLGIGGGVWFSGVSLTDTTGAADVTASQPIVYTATGSSIVPNGTFSLGTLQGWVLNPAAPFTLGSDSFGQRAFVPGGIGVGGGFMFSPAFQVNPGAKYRITYTVYHGSGSGGIFLRVAWQPGSSQPANVIPGGTGSTSNPGFQDFLANGSVTSSPVAMAFDWTAPAGANFASLALYAIGASDLAVQSVACVPYAATGQFGADVTGSNTSNDTSHVDGVPSTTIASVVPTGFKLEINSGARLYSLTAI
ncbi:carbohydrate binding domain-containing protein [Tunturiibacter gelidiferens]|uniref:carbohydrate binding domain-containing protein n=1 Tax=Tunturiibacter gelidiferens TaxID=3069689 RepID=UPI003D9B7358